MKRLATILVSAWESMLDRRHECICADTHAENKAVDLRWFRKPTCPPCEPFRQRSLVFLTPCSAPAGSCREFLSIYFFLTWHGTMASCTCRNFALTDSGRARAARSGNGSVPFCCGPLDNTRKHGLGRHKVLQRCPSVSSATIELARLVRQAMCLYSGPYGNYLVIREKPWGVFLHVLDASFLDNRLQPPRT